MVYLSLSQRSCFLSICFISTEVTNHVNADVLYAAAGGMGAMLSAPSAFVVGGAQEGKFFSVFLPMITAVVGFWATLSLNISDFTRYASSQRWGSAG
jgi:cytosine/uracil/thiamine/allantoin permease